MSELKATPLVVSEEVTRVLYEALQKARNRFQAISDFGDPDEISEEPEEFGGTDDGHETVCMAYENMQFIAERGLPEIDEALSLALNLAKAGTL